MKNSKTKQIVNSISLLAQLPAGDALVQVLGRGNERTNLEALGHWVENQKDLLTIAKSDHLIEQFLHRLHNKLESFSTVSFH